MGRTSCSHSLTRSSGNYRSSSSWLDPGAGGGHAPTLRLTPCRPVAESSPGTTEAVHGGSGAAPGRDPVRGIFEMLLTHGNYSTVITPAV
jgi:hypothetical protein